MISVVLLFSSRFLVLSKVSGVKSVPAFCSVGFSGFLDHELFISF